MKLLYQAGEHGNNALRLNKLTADTVCFVSSLVTGSIISPVTDTPAQEQTAETTISISVKSEERQGMRQPIPYRSTALSTNSMPFRLFLFAGIDHPSHKSADSGLRSFIVCSGF